MHTHKTHIAYFHCDLDASLTEGTWYRKKEDSLAGYAVFQRKETKISCPENLKIHE